MRLLSLTFEQSKRVTLKRRSRKLLMWDEKTERENNRFFSRLKAVFLLGGFMMMSYALGIEPGLIKLDSGWRGVRVDTGIYVHQVSQAIRDPLEVILVILGVLMVIYLMVPTHTLLRQRILSWWVMTLFMIMVIMACQPLLMGAALANDGIVTTIIWSIELVVLFCWQSWNFCRHKIAAVDGIPIVHRQKELLSIGAIVILINVLMPIGEELIRGSFQLGGLLWGFLFVLINIAMIYLITLVWYPATLNWYYIAKYPVEYRRYYQIPDRMWYYTAKRAAKHPRVFPPADQDKAGEG